MLDVPDMSCRSSSAVICGVWFSDKKMSSVSSGQGCLVEGAVNLPNLSNFPSRKELSHRAGKTEPCQEPCAKQLLDGSW